MLDFFFNKELIKGHVDSQAGLTRGVDVNYSVDRL